MSRRKQSNPKPLKRQSDGEDDEPTDNSEIQNGSDNVKDEEDSSVEHLNEKIEHSENSPSSRDNSVRDCSEETQKMTKCEATLTQSEYDSKLKENGTDCEIYKDNVKNRKFVVPDDALFLKKVEDDDVIATGRPYLVCNSVPLSKGICIGPFRGEVVSLSSIQQGDLVLQAQERDGETGFVRVLEDTGAWLALLRPAPHDASINSTVSFEGGKLLCEIVNDLDAGSELLASFTINNESSDSETESTTDAKTHIKPGRQISTPASSDNSNMADAGNTSSPKLLTTHAALLYGCPYCGVRFSSSRTLQGHLTFYCSKKPHPSTGMAHNVARDSLEAERDSFLKRKHTPSPDSTDHDKYNGLDGSDHDTPTKSAKTGEIYKCQLCSYTTDKQSSLNRHKRIHNRGDNSPEESRSDTYCAKCNIQFSSVSTYRCHRDVYCPQRSSDTDRSSVTSLSPRIKSPHSELMTNVLHAGLPLGLREAMLKASSSSPMPGQPRIILAPPIVAPHAVANGDENFQAVIVQPVVASPDANKPAKVEVAPPNRNESCEAKHAEDQPLDLSTTKTDVKRNEGVDMLLHPVKEELSPTKVKDEPLSPRSTLSVLQTPPTPVTPTAKVSPSPSHSSGRSSEKIPITASTILAPAMPSLLNVHQIPFLGNMGKPIPPVSHAVSKCIDCNIVFYKRENFLIHKKHYCSSRRNKSPDSDDSGMRQSMSSASYAYPPEKSEHESNYSEKDYTEKHSMKSNSPRQSPNTPKEETETLSNAKHLQSPRSSAPDDVMYRFYCIPCKIKFSSASTLKAHKEFYCPHGKESEHSIVVKKSLEEQSNSSQDSDDVNVKCERCDAVFASSRLLKHHFCSGISAHMPLTRCMYCDFVTQTEMRLHEHMKAHMPNKAYRCTLCGYRGNTVRGMRMHGKTHLDNGEEFTDEHMIEIEEPPLMPIKIHNSITPDSRPLDIEAELIRMKNEPYKRRRSRKSYEKAEYASSIPPQRQNVSASHFSNVCVFCGQIFTDISAFAMHLKIHEMMALQAASALENRNYKCQHCSHIADTMDNLFAHVCTRHPEKIPRELSISPKSQPASPRSNSRSSSTTSQPENINHESKVVDSFSKPSEYSSKQSGVPLTTENNIKSEPMDIDDHRCQSETTATSEVIHKIKQEPKTVDENEDVDIMDNNENIPQKSSTNEFERSKEITTTCKSPLAVKEEPDCRTDIVRSPLGSHRENKSETSSPRSEKSSASRGSTPKSKIEVTNGIDKKCPPLVIPRTNHMLPYYQLIPDFHIIPTSLPVVNGQASLPGVSKGGKPTAKYCQHCDISFTYQATFLAHKKYYCSASVSDDITPSATA